MEHLREHGWEVPQRKLVSGYTTEERDTAVSEEQRNGGKK